MTTTIPEPYLCIKPACGSDCSGCNKAISAQTMRDYAIAHAAALAAPQPEPVALCDALRWSGAKESHGAMMFSPDQLRKFYEFASRTAPPAEPAPADWGDQLQQEVDPAKWKFGPAPAPAVPLTDADIDRIADAVPVDDIGVHITTWHRRFARAVLSAAPAVREPKPAELLGMAVVDAIVDDGMRNAAGGIYATRVQEFAREVQIAFAQQNRVDLSGIGGGGK